ncbi:carboxypeptidase-like regulatory domain-containing protein [Hymenobacter arizonensis]|uniref:CarboxypepD_reg-like domain-containing protein n=1 Tax=Hymenobacter arizonensis TaxID=1227077 RepID=A0A1I6B745_HYMAR|nr:carboxypeptidase-like regulatory domain-containing protein [Hymenobacter arizonensis]SFQ76755.1 CarboxypepD_reg-like domain-containing protein [Hymenobacter arizonensis]
MLTTRLAIPQPCAESWDAMRPASNGRHCAACQKTVVDFTLKTDAEILAYLAGAASTRTCGRFAAGQLDRPLQRAVPAAPTRWRAWLGAAVAVWGLRETASTVAPAQTSTEWRSQYWGGPAPATPPPAIPVTPVQNTVLPAALQTVAGDATVPDSAHPLLVAASSVIRGTVTDFSTGDLLPGCTILIKGTELGTSTNREGKFELTVPATLAGVREITLVVSSVGCVTQERTLRTDYAVEQAFRLQTDVKGMLLGEVVMLQPSKLPPAPWKLRHLYYWSKYWVTQPFL